MNKILLLILLFPILSFSQDQIEHIEELDKQSLEQIEYDIMLNDSKLATTVDSTTGIESDPFHTGDDKGRYSFLYHVNGNITKFSTISSFEFIYSTRMDWAWLDFSIVRSSAKIANITVYNTNINTPTSEFFDEAHAITEVGIGLSYRTKYVQEIIKASSLFETIGAAVQYVNFSENFFDESFNGIGMKADFGLHIRSSKAFHYGLKMSTHIASVKKSETVSGQSDTTRALLLRWISLGADLTFYY